MITLYRWWVRRRRCIENTSVAFPPPPSFRDPPGTLWRGWRSHWHIIIIKHARLFGLIDARLCYKCLIGDYTSASRLLPVIVVSVDHGSRTCTKRDRINCCLWRLYMQRWLRQSIPKTLTATVCVCDRLWCRWQQSIRKTVAMMWVGGCMCVCVMCRCMRV